MMFHGGGGSAYGVKRDTGWTDLADKECFLVIFPDGLPSDLDQPPSFLRNPQLWNDGSGRFILDVDDIGFVEALLGVITLNFPVDPGRIYATGFSNGASMAFRVGIELQDIFSAVAPVSGALWFEDFTLDTPVSLLYMTGTADPLNPMEGGVPRLITTEGEPGGNKAKPPVEEHLQSWSEALGCNPERQVVVEEDILKAEKYSGCAGGSEVLYYTLDGVGHHWPGGEIRLPESLVGEGTDAVQATEIIWDFFKSHPRP
jgi:polyhydroxybutyrate depolymerase